MKELQCAWRSIFWSRCSLFRSQLNKALRFPRLRGTQLRRRATIHPFDASNYPNQTTKDIAKQATDASLVVFDGSDVMPKEVGSGTFWTGMVDWIQGQSSQATTAAIEKSWPQ